ncbi:hypothetical protein COV17_04090 [Candidatus Woesearchaeota archaeon CG10_big_fil_rev_8_21_14_0_10_36_11]|nr:MAG: hypothetical protein COV17_04090 [Candidatus Woesearchaeota archaeon CG10_big_fil_rev_8_21_14_0_10_36_11]
MRRIFYSELMKVLRATISLLRDVTRGDPDSILSTIEYLENNIKESFESSRMDIKVALGKHHREERASIFLKSIFTSLLGVVRAYTNGTVDEEFLDIYIDIVVDTLIVIQKGLEEGKEAIEIHYPHDRVRILTERGVKHIK